MPAFLTRMSYITFIILNFYPIPIQLLTQDMETGAKIGIVMLFINFSSRPAGDKKTPVLKYGISHLTRFGTDRPALQKPGMIKRWGPTADCIIITWTSGRDAALAIELGYVVMHMKV